MYSQQYPVQVISSVQAPVPVNFYNYADDTSLNSPIRVQIFLNDLTISNRRIRLKTYFEGGNISFQSKDIVFGAEDLYLDGGIPLILGNAELAPYYKYQNIQGIGAATYGQSIPEGSYNFCFEVYDYLTGFKLSDKKCTTVYIFKNEPPILNLPFNETNIIPNDFENIVFQWTPRHINVSNVEYELSIVEIWDDYIAPETAFLSQIPIYQETTRTTTLIYGPDKPLLLPDKKYAWRVQAKALQGIEEIGLFKNEGYSEIFWFSRTSPCQVPQNISAEAKGLTKINVFWDEDPTVYSDYIIAYREAGKEDAFWFTKKTNSSWATIWDLKPGTTYEYKIKGKCTYQYSEFSNVQEVTTDVVQNEDANYQCGIVPDEVAISNREPHPGLNAGDQISAGDFNIVITDINSQSSGMLSGEGYVSIPYLNMAKFAVNFTNILVNTNNQLAEGEIVTVYDPEFGEGASMTVDVNVNISEGVNGDDGEIEELVEVDFVIENITIDANGAFVITGTNGEEAIVPGDDDITIKGSNGDIWSVGEDGTITKEEGADGGAVTADSTNGIGADGNVASVTAEGVLVTFEESGYYSFDGLPEGTSSSFEEQYKIIDTKAGNKYNVAYKAISDNNGEDFINASVAITDDKIVKDSIVFKTKDGAKVIVDFWNGNTAKLKLQRKFHYADEEIYATIKNENGKYDVAGTLITTHLASQELEPINIKLVPVGTTINEGLISRTKEIYAKAGVTLNISALDKIDAEQIIGWDIDGDQRLKVGDSKILSHYTNEEKVFNNYIKNQSYYSAKTYYVFVTNVSTTDAEVDGFMPLKRQFGYVFTKKANTVEEQSRTLAHELGHGIFGLEHTWDEYSFPQGATNFLMDYGNGTVLNHIDWKKIHAPGMQLYWFQGDEDGQHYTTKGYFREKEFGENKDENKTFTFLTPSAQYIVLPNNVKNVTKFYGYYGNSFLEEEEQFKEFLSIVPGTIKSFEIDEETYEAKITKSGNSLFLEGYFFEDKEYSGLNFNIELSDKNTKEAIIFAVEDNGGTIGYNAILLSTSNYTEFNKEAEVKSPLYFPYENKEVKNLKSIGIQSTGSQYSYSSEEVNWAFGIEEQNYSRTDNTLLIRNKLLEFKTAYPRFLEEYVGNSDVLPISWSICSDYSLPNNYLSKFEMGLKDEYCDCYHSSPPQTGPGQPTDVYNCSKKDGVTINPQTRKEWLTLLYTFLQEKALKINEEISNSIIDYNLDNEKIKKDSSNDIAYIINIASQNDIGQLSVETILSMISKFVNETFTPESSSARKDLEGAIIKLVKYSNKNINKVLLEGIEGNNVYNSKKVLSEQIFYAVDDSFLFFGSDNRNELIVEFTKKIFDTPDLYDERLVEAVNDIENRTFIFEYTNFVGRALVELGNVASEAVTLGVLETPLSNYYKTETIDKDFITDEDDAQFGKIKLIQKTQSGFRTIEIEGKDPFKIDYSNEDYFKPFDLIFFTNKSNLSSAKAYENGIAKKDYPIPAIAVAYVSQAGENQTTADGIFTVIDVASLAISGTPLVSTVSALSKARKVFYTLDVISSVSSVTAIGISDHEELNEIKNILNTFSAITGVASMGDIVSGVKLKDLLRNAKNSVDEADDLASNIRSLTNNINKIEDYAELSRFVSNYEEVADKYLALALKDLQDAKYINDVDAVNDIKKAISKILNAKKGLKINPDDFKSVINFTEELSLIKNYVSKSDDYIDVIVHSNKVGDNFSVAIEVGGKVEDIVLSPTDFAKMLSDVPTDKTIRLLSCNNTESAIEIAKALNRDIIASSGEMRLYDNGLIETGNWFIAKASGEVEDFIPKRYGLDPTDNYVILGKQLDDPLLEAIRVGNRSKGTLATALRNAGFPKCADAVAGASNVNKNNKRLLDVGDSQIPNAKTDFSSTRNNITYKIGTPPAQPNETWAEFFTRLNKITEIDGVPFRAFNQFESHHIFPVDLFKQESFRKWFELVGHKHFDINGDESLMNLIMLEAKRKNAISNSGDPNFLGGVHANHPTYTSKIGEYVDNLWAKIKKDHSNWNESQIADAIDDDIIQLAENLKSSLLENSVKGNVELPTYWKNVKFDDLTK